MEALPSEADTPAVAASSKSPRASQPCTTMGAFLTPSRPASYRPLCHTALLLPHVVCLPPDGTYRHHTLLGNRKEPIRLTHHMPNAFAMGYQVAFQRIGQVLYRPFVLARNANLWEWGIGLEGPR